MNGSRSPLRRQHEAGAHGAPAVIVVDDSATMRAAIMGMLRRLGYLPCAAKDGARLLERRGHVVTIARDGVEAVALVGERSFHLILMDLQMPKLDGVAATEAIRQHEAATGRPRQRIVAMTADALVGTRERCLAADMDDYISKPVDPKRLFELVEVGDSADEGASDVDELARPATSAPQTRLQQAPPRESPQRARRGRGDTDHDGASASVLDDELDDELPVCDRSKAIEVCGTISSWHELAGIVLTEAGQLLDQAESSAEARLRATHTIKAAAAAVGATALAATAGRLDAELRRDAGAPAVSLDPLRVGLARFAEQVRGLGSQVP